MLMPFRPYQKRAIAFRGLTQTEGWTVKVYAITPHDNFRSEAALQAVIKQLPQLLQPAEAHYHLAFLIVHEGTDGLWSLINWWTGGEMLRTDTYFSDYDQPEALSQYPQQGSMACVWELPVINQERELWVKHILCQAEQPDVEGYLHHALEGKI
ncbi:MAG: hypothetical protein KDC44_22665 [Phaeodactylibacter sp.]|nr:hypothetical protein [Phaeodactylibacter sp.]